jgi:GNAT superfamily N-acetyltransferase
MYIHTYTYVYMYIKHKHVHTYIHIRTTADSAEVVRMAVNPEMRGKGLGKLLIKELDKFCLVTGVLHVSEYIYIYI